MQSEAIDQLATALAQAQGEMTAAAKSKENPFFKSKYSDLPAVWEACRAALSKNGLSIIQAPQYDEVTGATWIETTLAHSSGQWMRSKYPLRPVKEDPQSLGSAVTYGRRYALMGMVGVVADDEDDDANAASGRTGSSDKPKAPAPTAKTAAKQWAKTAEDTIRACDTQEALDAWEEANKNHLPRLAKADPDAHKQVIDALADQYEKLNPNPMAAE